MKYKLGDKLLCRNGNFLSRYITGKYYKIIYIDEITIRVKAEDSGGAFFTYDDLSIVFYTHTEIRKIKLEKLKKNI